MKKTIKFIENSSFGAWVKFTGRRIVYFFRHPFLYFKNRFFEAKHFTHQLAAVAIMKDEGSYLCEWIEFHRLVGVEKFYLYDNGSTDNTRKILEPYIKNGIVEYTYFPGQRLQKPAYMDALCKHRYDTKWLAVFDLDEFLVPASTETVPEFMNQFPDNVSQVMIGWLNFGSNGHITMPDGLVIDSYTRRAPGHINNKTIINPRRTYKMGIHTHVTFGKTVDVNGVDFHGVRFSSGENPSYTSALRLHHYCVKSREEFLKRRSRGCALRGTAFGEKRWNDKYFALRDNNEILDETAIKWSAAVRKKCGIK
ncbi:MAG: glycosyltransferase family 92 protein [Alphaproteobacteria bacterium]|nr:glycosyltransferase family 92 protein [Alphaproteobacteria bacterium]